MPCLALLSKADFHDRRMTFWFLLLLTQLANGSFNVTLLQTSLQDLGCANTSCPLFDYVQLLNTSCPMTLQPYENGRIACNLNGDIVHLVCSFGLFVCFFALERFFTHNFNNNLFSLEFV